MKHRPKLLSLTVSATIILLTIAGTLIVVGIFNSTLKWDIFGPKIEAVLYGVFGSCIALSCIGVAMTVVLGTQEIVNQFRLLQQQRSTDAVDAATEATMATYAKYLLFVVCFLSAAVTLLAIVNHGVQKHRSEVFKRLVTKQMEHFQPKLSGLIADLSEPPQDHVPRDLYDLVKTFDNLSFINTTSLYLPDPDDTSAMWVYTARRQYKKEDGFARFFVATEFEQAMAKGISGNAQKLKRLNKEMGFFWYGLVKDQGGKPIAVLQIKGNSSENFREYILGS